MLGVVDHIHAAAILLLHYYRKPLIMVSCQRLLRNFMEDDKVQVKKIADPVHKHTQLVVAQMDTAGHCRGICARLRERHIDCQFEKGKRVNLKKK